MEEEYKVKGSSITSKFAFVQEKFGIEAENELKAEFEARKYYPILDALWYPFSFYVDVNMAIVDKFFNGNIVRLREVGEYSAEKVLTTVYSSYVSGGDFIGFLKQISALHKRFYSVGHSVVEVGSNDKSCKIHLKDKPSYSKADLHVAEGFYTGSTKLFGYNYVMCKFTIDDDGAHFNLTWG